MVAKLNQLIAIVGPTASGKSALAMQVAARFSGEIICADSRTIYRGMDIGTAKASPSDRSTVCHHLLDILEPNQTYSAAQFKAAALKSIADIQGRSHLPILVGGSGLYVYAVLYDYDFPAGASNRLRQELQNLSIDELVERLQQLDPEVVEAVDLKNPRRVIRAIETAGQSKQQSQLIDGVILVGIVPQPNVLEERIAARTEDMLEAGLVTETKQLLDKYGPDLEVLKSPGYAECRRYIEGAVSAADLEGLINLHTRQLAKRQLTWFRRNPDITWFSNSELAYNNIAARLSAKTV